MFGPSKDEIIVCDYHSEYPTPLIWTFAFHSCEYWCPYCGGSWGMMGAGITVKRTDELTERHKLYKEASRKYLDAVGSDSIVEWPENCKIENTNTESK